MRTFFVFSLFEALHSGQQFFSQFGTGSWVKPVLSNQDEESCPRIQRHALGEDQTFNLAINSLPNWAITESILHLLLQVKWS